MVPIIMEFDTRDKFLLLRTDVFGGRFQIEFRAPPGGRISSLSLLFHSLFESGYCLVLESC